jgi:hypothetical protein
MLYNQNANRNRRIVSDEDALRQLIERSELPQLRQSLVPASNQANEYRIFNDDQIPNNQLEKYVDKDAVELDMNRDRNRVLQETWG